VTDIADAMILRRLFTELFDLGMVMFTTSNRHPNELYKNGIQRASFIPCIDIIKSRCNLYNLDSGVDYRKIEKAIGKGYFYPLNGETSSSIDALFKKLVGDTKVDSKKLSLLGRSVEVPMQSASMKIARFSFEDLCGKSLSAADYLELVKHYDVIFMENIPRLGFDQRNETRRFITLLDTLYENRIKLICSAETDIDRLFRAEEVQFVSIDFLYVLVLIK
jgi:peroxisome-assembly ATPase